MIHNNHNSNGRDHDLYDYRPIHQKWMNLDTLVRDSGGSPLRMHEVIAAPTPEETEDRDPDLMPETLARFLDYLPTTEADILEMYYRGSTQKDLAEVLGCTQANISHLLHKGLERIRWLAEIEPYRCSEAEIRGLLTEGVLRQCCMLAGGPCAKRGFKLQNLVVTMCETTCLTTTKRQLGASYSWTWQHWQPIVLGLEMLTAGPPARPEFLKTATYLRAVFDHPGILHAPKSWDRGRRGPPRGTPRKRPGS